ncbi:hypothetical protein HC766_01365 [Candidatus Gracilibacteria bacterium]|nr:hypothetical protein [Candidatus Gracilibacteria bacterium]
MGVSQKGKLYMEIYLPRRSEVCAVEIFEIFVFSKYFSFCRALHELMLWWISDLIINREIGEYYFFKGRIKLDKFTIGSEVEVCQDFDNISFENDLDTTLEDTEATELIEKINPKPLFSKKK